MVVTTAADPVLNIISADMLNMLYFEYIVKLSVYCHSSSDSYFL